MASIVGGIFYRPQQKKELKDIYNETIDLPTLSSYVHEPVRVDSRPSGYQPQYQFSTPTQTETREESQTAEQSQTNPIVPTLVIPTYGEVSTQTTQVPQSYSSNEDAWNKAWEQYGSNLGIKDQKAYAYLLGQIKHESGDFKYMEGLNTGEEYEGRKDLGNTQKGDGKRYKERGPIQVTGRTNYEKIYKDFFVPNGLGEYDIVNNPELAKDPYIGSLLSIGWLATTNNGKRAIDAANKYDIKGATYAINGGYNGLNDRIKRTNDLLKNLT